MNSTVPTSHRDLLEAKGFAFVATIGPDTAPQVSPTWYVWDAASEQLLLSLTTRRQKYRNLRRVPLVAVCIPDPADPCRYLELRGGVAAVEIDENRVLINTLTKNYVDQDEHIGDDPGDVRVVIRIGVEHARCFG